MYGLAAPETVAVLAEVRAVRAVVDGLQDYPHYLLHDFVPRTRYTQSPEFAVGLRYERLTNGPTLVALVFHLRDDFADFFL